MLLRVRICAFSPGGFSLLSRAGSIGRGFSSEPSPIPRERWCPAQRWWCETLGPTKRANSRATRGQLPIQRAARRQPTSSPCPRRRSNRHDGRSSACGSTRSSARMSLMQVGAVAETVEVARHHAAIADQYGRHGNRHRQPHGPRASFQRAQLL